VASVPRDLAGDPPGRRRPLLSWVARLVAPLRAEPQRVATGSAGALERVVRPSWWQLRSLRPRRRVPRGLHDAGAVASRGHDDVREPLVSSRPGFGAADEPVVGGTPRAADGVAVGRRPALVTPARALAHA
jgi:hypothetical protein